VNESDHSLGASSWSAVHELDPVSLELLKGARQVVNDVTGMVESRFRVLGDELRDTRNAVGRFDELDPLALVTEEQNANVLIRKLVDPARIHAERVAEKGKRLFDAWDRDRDVVQRSELHSRGGT